MCLLLLCWAVTTLAGVWMGTLTHRLHQSDTRGRAWTRHVRLFLNFSPTRKRLNGTSRNHHKLTFLTDASLQLLAHSFISFILFCQVCVCSKLLGSSDVTLNVFVFAVHDLQSFGLDNVSSSTDVFSFACLSFCNNCHVLFSPFKHITCLYKSPVSSLWWCMSSSLVIWTYLSLSCR